MKTLLCLLFGFLFFLSFYTNVNAQSNCWKEGEVITYGQGVWGDLPSPGNAARLLVDNYDLVYLATGGLFEVGIPGASGYSMIWTNVIDLLSYLPAGGTSGPLNSDLIDATSSSAGVFGGNVVALKLNIDFSDFGLTTGTSGLKFGDLILYNYDDLPLLNGLSVRELEMKVETLLGGGTWVYTISQLSIPLSNINGSFNAGHASTTAQEHLRIGWKDGDVISYGQASWGETPSTGNAAMLLQTNFGNVYNKGVLEVGIPGDSGYSMLWTNVTDLLGYLPATGISASLNGDLLNPSSSVSGVFGGNVTAMRLNIDFSDSGLLTGNSGLKFGNLTMCDFNILTSLNGINVRQFHEIVNTLLGGITSIYTIADLASVIGDMNRAFEGGLASIFAQSHLFNGDCPCNNNQCPIAKDMNFVTTEGTAINIILQGSDSDNDSISYSISLNPAHGTASTSSDGSATYTPTAGYIGTDIFKYKVSDGLCGVEAIVNLSVAKVKVFTGNITLGAQTDINAFGDSSYTTITGTITIKGASSITDLAPLSTITSIGEWLTIDSNDLLTNLNGLHNINSIGGLLTVSHNPVLTGIDPLNKITSVSGITISFNDALTNINGLSNITTVNGGNLHIDFNPSITNIDPLSKITSVGGGLYIRNCDSLKNLKGLSHIDSVGGSLYVQNNPSITNLEGLDNLVSVGNNLYVQNNIALTDFCSLFTLFDGNGLGGFYYVNGNAVNPRQSDIKTAGPCITTSAADTKTISIPTTYTLEQNYPNPFNPSTKIEYEIPKQSYVTLKVYNVLGEEITTLVNEQKSLGTYEVTWNATNLPSGIYFYRIQVGSFVETKKMILLK